MDHVEQITSSGRPLAYIIRAPFAPAATTFVTPSELTQQVGFVVYPAGGEITRHVHLPLERHLVATSEVMLCRRGRGRLDVYVDSRNLGATRRLQSADLVL